MVPVPLENQRENAADGLSRRARHGGRDLHTGAGILRTAVGPEILMKPQHDLADGGLDKILRPLPRRWCALGANELEEARTGRLLRHRCQPARGRPQVGPEGVQRLGVASQSRQTDPTAIVPPAACGLLERPQGLLVGALRGEQVANAFRGEPQLVKGVPVPRIQRGGQGVLPLRSLVLTQTVQAVGQLIGQLPPGEALSRVDLEELGRQPPVAPGACELGRPLAARLAAGSLTSGREAGSGAGPITVTVSDDPLFEELVRAEPINAGQGIQGAPGRPVQAHVELRLKELAQPGGVVLVLGQTGEQNLQTLPLRGARRQAGEQALRVASVSHS